jgi:ribosomal protein S18 acetylase RimI-like enzyme
MTTVTEQVRIRPSRPGDLDALYQVCLQTGHNGDDATAMYRDHKLLGHVHAGPYAMLEPELAFVAEDEAGVGGYILGTLDSLAFEARAEREWWPRLRRQYPAPPAGLPEDSWTMDQAKACSIHQPWTTPPELARDYPSHLHINLVTRLQSGGNGRRLMTVFTDELRRRGSHGVHLYVRPANLRAIGFYRHVGFTERPTDIDNACLYVMDLRPGAAATG